MGHLFDQFTLLKARHGLPTQHAARYQLIFRVHTEYDPVLRDGMSNSLVDSVHPYMIAS